MTISPLRSFRLVCKPGQAPLVEALLLAQGFCFEPEPFFPLARRLTHEPLPLGSSLAAAFGLIYIQDRSSMLPPLVLNPEPGKAVLDMCASPGSKTGLLAQIVGEEGFVLGNEPSKNRLATLRNNLRQMNLFCCGTSSHPGESLPLPGAGDVLAEGAPCPGWDFLLLDPPCSGWGTVEKNPQVLRLWRGDKVRPLILLQRRLLAEALRLLRPGGRLVYSTCTTNVEENEEQVRHARDALGFMTLPIAAVPGFAFAEPALSGLDGTLRIDTGPDGQGFFVALLQKPANRTDVAVFSDDNGPPPSSPETGKGPHKDPDNSPDNGPGKGFFVRPWEKESRFVGERRRHAKAANRRDTAVPRPLSREALESAFVDAARLPAGELAVYGDGIHFLPQARGNLLPESFSWKGFPLGRVGRNGEVRVSPGLRGLMPDAETARSRGLPILCVDDPGPLLSLLNGQSLAVSAKGPELGLYFGELPLCRLAVKGSRAVLPPL